jgi:hypothetical protein
MLMIPFFIVKKVNLSDSLKLNVLNVNYKHNSKSCTVGDQKAIMGVFFTQYLNNYLNKLFTTVGVLEIVFETHFKGVYLHIDRKLQKEQ